MKVGKFKAIRRQSTSKDLSHPTIYEDQHNPYGWDKVNMPLFSSLSIYFKTSRTIDYPFSSSPSVVSPHHDTMIPLTLPSSSP